MISYAVICQSLQNSDINLIYVTVVVLHNLGTLIPSLPHPKLSFVFLLPKIKKWPLKLVKMSKRCITARLTMTIKHIGVRNKICRVREFSCDVSEGHIATINKQCDLNLITTIIVTHHVVSPKF